MHSHDKLRGIKQATDQFIAKQLRQNKPLQSLQGTDQYEKFHAAIQRAIKKQLKAMSQNLPHQAVMSIPGNSEYWVEQNLPPLGDFIDVDDVFEYFKFCFEWGVKAQYKRFGLKLKASSPYFMKAGAVDFELTNPQYIAALEDASHYLVNLSKLDSTTIQQIISLIGEATDEGMTMDEVAGLIRDNIGNISEARANVISRTETANAMGRGNFAAMVENGVQTKAWITAGSNPCEICQGNADAGFIPIGDSFPSGDDYEPAHPNDECYTEAGEIDLESIDIWGGE